MNCDNQKLIEEANNKVFNNSATSHDNIVFVYSQPKVGSTSLVSSIRISASDNFNVIHFHDDSTLRNLLGIKDVTINDIIAYNANIGKKVYVIDVFRTPIERKISVFFEEIANFHFNNLEENVNEYDVNRVIKRFNDIFPYIGNSDNYLDNYNIQPSTFDHDKKCICDVINNVTYIKLRLKDSIHWGNILTNILGQEIIIVKDYETKNKGFAKLFESFNNHYKLPSNYLETLTSCRLLNHFYTTEERNGYTNNWSQKITNSYTSFTSEQYNSYLKISLENQSRNFIQIEHYIDPGCLCKCCFTKRQELFKKAKSGEIITEKIIHNKLLNAHKDNVKNNLVSRINSINNERKKHFKNEILKNKRKDPSFSLKTTKISVNSALASNLMNSIIIKK